jgi:hypothetical protein
MLRNDFTQNWDAIEVVQEDRTRNVPGASRFSHANLTGGLPSTLPESPLNERRDEAPRLGQAAVKAVEEVIKKTLTDIGSDVLGHGFAERKYHDPQRDLDNTAVWEQQQFANIDQFLSDVGTPLNCPVLSVPNSATGEHKLTPTQLQALEAFIQVIPQLAPDKNVRKDLRFNAIQMARSITRQCEIPHTGEASGLVGAAAMAATEIGRVKHARAPNVTQAFGRSMRQVVNTLRRQDAAKWTMTAMTGGLPIIAGLGYVAYKTGHAAFKENKSQNKFIKLIVELCEQTKRGQLSAQATDACISLMAAHGSPLDGDKPRDKLLDLYKALRRHTGTNAEAMDALDAKVSQALSPQVLTAFKSAGL